MSATLFLGLGRMGAPMARLHAAAFATRVFDVFPAAAEAVAADSAAEALSDLADIGDDVASVILMLPTSHHVEEVLRGNAGLLARLPRGALVIDMGSSEPASTRTLAAEAAALGIDYVDAPVSGGIAKAETGSLTVMVGARRMRWRARCRTCAPSARRSCTSARQVPGTRRRRSTTS